MHTGGCVFKLGKLIVLQGEAKKYNGDAGVNVANWEVVPTQVWGPRRCGARCNLGLALQGKRPSVTLCSKAAPFEPAQKSSVTLSFYNRKASINALCALEE